MMADSTKTKIGRFEHAEAALRLSEATKSAILETALDCIVTIDHLGFVLDWNPAAERTFGYSRSEALGREMAELIVPPALQGMHRAGLQRATATGQDALGGKRIEITARRRNGEEFPVELAITRISAGASPLFTGHIRDISERKRVENELRASQQLLASITGNITEAIFRRSLTEGLLFVNEAYIRMFGFASAEEIRGVAAETLYANPGHRAEIVAMLEREGGLRAREIEYRRKDGTTFWGLTSAAGIRDATTGKILFFDGAIHDITERKQAEQLQATQYAMTRALADSETLDEVAPRILREACQGLRWDFGTLWRVDAAAGLMKGVDIWHAPDVPAKTFSAATLRSEFAEGVGLPGRIWSAREAQWIYDLAGDTNFPRGEAAAKNGFHSAFGFPIRLGQEVLGALEFFSRDVRHADERILAMFNAIGSQIGQFIQRKQAEESLRQLNQDLERRIAARTVELTALNAELTEAKQHLVKALEQEKELNQLKTNFVNVVSHEFRTPLGVIMSSADILDSYLDRLKPEQRAEHLRCIRQSTEQMASLMEEVLLLGRVEAGKMEFKPQPMDLAEFCQRLVDEQLSATNRKCPIRLELNKIPAKGTGDETVLRHIFTNLLSNAVKYSRAGSEITFTAHREGSDAVFEVRDHGIGIPQADQRRLFEAFHRAQNVGNLPGTGLGLAIVKRCVDLAQGTINVTSTVGQGSTFVVRLKMFDVESIRKQPGQTKAKKSKDKTKA